MKSKIDECFDYGCKGSNSIGASDYVDDKSNNDKSDLNKISAPEDEGVKLNGKENGKTKRKTKVARPSKGKIEVAATGGTSQMKNLKTQKKKLNMNNQLTGQECVNENEHKEDQGLENSVCTAKGFSLKIRMKSKADTDCDTFIDECSSPDGVSVPNEKSKELKSPQATMLKYLVSQKSCPTIGTELSPVCKTKVNRAISDFFSPTKHGSSDSLQNTTMKQTDEVQELGASKKLTELRNKSSLEGSSEEATATSAPKSGKKSKKKCLSTVKTSNEPARKTASKVKSNRMKKSLSLSKIETTIESTEQSEIENQTTASNDDLKLGVARSMNNALKKIMSKSASGLSVCSPSKKQVSLNKRKRSEDDYDCDADCKPSKSIKEDSPVKSQRRSSRSNQIESDSDEDKTESKVKDIGNSLTVLHSGSEDIGETPEVLQKGEDSKRNSLMNYFAKVSKQEIVAKEEKIEMKVKAMVHSPPTTPSKKKKRRSVNSLPGGAASLSKRKGNLKNKLKENVNAIEIIDIEATKGNIKNNKDSSLLQANAVDKNPVTVGSISPKARSPPCKSLSLHKSSDLSDLKIKQTRKVSKKAPAKPDCELNEEKKMVTVPKTDKSVKSIKIVDDESLATPLEISNEDMSKPSVAPTPWKMRVCLTPSQLPSSQGTLLEEESDCDEIFSTRKDKKRKLDRQIDGGKCKQKDVSADIRSRRSASPDIIFEKETTSMGVKVAPLFTRKAETQARQLFLQSGVPEQVKRVQESQRSFDDQEADIFPKVSHVQQKSRDEWLWNLLPVATPSKSDSLQDKPQASSKFSLSDLTGCCNIYELVDHTNLTSCKGPEMRSVCDLPLDIVKPILRLIRQDSPDIKVVNTFKTLRTKMREEDFAKAAALADSSEISKSKRKSTNRKVVNSESSTSGVMYRAHVWTEKYKPTTASEIVGNGASVQQLKRWLEAWRKASNDVVLPNKDKKIRNKRKDAIDDDDDFVVSGNSSDENTSNLPVGVAVLHGPNGTGKTSAVYALAKDLGYKVLEVNASEKRNGKLVLSKLSEATQSHQVQQSNTVQQGFATLFANKKNPPKTKNQKVSKAQKSVAEPEDDKAKKMSLILFEDVDIVFEEEDEGFLSAISNLVSTSKRPVILTTSDPESSMVSRFMNSSSLILPFMQAPNLLSSWLQIVSILEGIYVTSQAVKDLVYVCKGDFRRALLQMQLWVTSGGNNLPMPSLSYRVHRQKSKKSNKDDADDFSDSEEIDGLDCIPSIPANTDCLGPIHGNNHVDTIKTSEEIGTCHVKVPYPLNLGLYWWNIPPMLSLKQVTHPLIPTISVKEEPSNTGPKRMLDDSFIASFCTDDGNSTGSGMNEDSDATCSQASEFVNEENVENKTDSSKLDADAGIHRSCCSQEDMRAMSSQMTCMSLIDEITTISKLHCLSSVEPVSSFSLSILKDSLSLTRSGEEGPNCVLSSTSQEISHWLAEQSLNLSKKQLCLENSSSCFNFCLPTSEEHRWREANGDAEKVALDAVPLCMHLEHRAISTDYIPTLRTFCRLERNRSNINTKRRNRFCHYLKSLEAYPTDLQLELLCCVMCNF